MSNESTFKGQALNYVVIVKEVNAENKTASGFDLTDIVSKDDKQKRGVIVSVGLSCPKKKYNSFLSYFLSLIFKDKVDGLFEIKPGDEVLFDKYKASDLTLDGVAYKTMYYADLIYLF